MRNRSMEAKVRRKFSGLRRSLDERGRRRWAATEARAIGRGGAMLVARATRLSRSTIHAGLRELREREATPQGRVRRPGGGRKLLAHSQPALCEALDGLVEPTSRGDPETPLRWTCKSVRRLAGELCGQGFCVGRQSVATMLHQLGDSLQANRKTREGKPHPDRDRQFRDLAWKVRSFQRHGQPVISVDTKKNELVGNFKNAGKTWRPRGRPTPVRVHDFPEPELGKVVPYGVYDVTANVGWVSVGTDHDTAEFAVETIRRWWRRRGRRRYPQATELLITADGGGSNGSRNRLWKLSLQQFANESGLSIAVSHFPPGTSKWNKIEHRMFRQISSNWRGQPLVSQEVIVELIGSTTNDHGLEIRAEINRRQYTTGIKVSDAELEEVNLHRDRFHGEWNYTIHPQTNASRRAA